MIDEPNSHSNLWYLLVGPHVRDLLVSVEVIKFASLLEDEKLAADIVKAAARHLETNAGRVASDPMPALAAVRQQFAGR